MWQKAENGPKIHSTHPNTNNRCEYDVCKRENENAGTKKKREKGMRKRMMEMVKRRMKQSFGCCCMTVVALSMSPWYGCSKSRAHTFITTIINR